MKAMILAAGRGKRMRPLTNTVPKPLLQVGELSIIEHLLIRLSKAGYHEIVINLAYLGEKIQERLKDGRSYNVHIQYSLENPDIGLETGGGIYHALPLLGDDPFLVVSGDIWTDYNFAQLRLKPLTGLAHLVLVDNPPYKQEGDFYLLGDKLTAGEGAHLTFGNMGVYCSELFANCQPGYFRLAPVLQQAVLRGGATGEHFRGEWLNIGTPAILATLRRKNQNIIQAVSESSG